MSNLSAGASSWAPPASTTAPAAGEAAGSDAKLSEKEEAAKIVAKAQADLEERKKAQQKVAGGMSKEELQALINAKSKR
eukprot:CAMPEP_0118646352 /NCGR_PEP_ID=MMETSP0785-20121206/8007_1 /TAXON_ID=91992 /ORGANISM="Bolidomonas pacifica, Strain CCMP 1866" /LENGTH=78 /DNA_ID=CAMNT_0006538333 /DNA_START=12 /DNA_END=248 /DNA_ORIENTATION=+